MNMSSILRLETITEMLSVFAEYHKFFESEYGELEVFIDDVVERIRQLGGKAISSIDELKPNVKLKEHLIQYPDYEKMFSNLSEDHESIICDLRADLVKSDQSSHNMGTNNFLTGLMK